MSDLEEVVARVIEPDAWSPFVWCIWPPRRIVQWKARRQARAILAAIDGHGFTIVPKAGGR